MEKHEVIEIGSRITIPNFIYNISFVYEDFIKFREPFRKIPPAVPRPGCVTDGRCSKLPEKASA